jgi:acetolactate synthase-1/2/3 large subunit
VARAYGATGVRVESADAFRPALADALARGGPVVIDVPMRNNPTPTTGHWNILDIYSPAPSANGDPAGPGTADPARPGSARPAHVATD